MKYIFIVLFLISCGGSSEVSNPKVYDFQAVDLSNAVFNDSSWFNGQIDYLNDNSWVFTSHTNPECFNSLASHCRKVNAKITEGQKVDGRIRRLKVELNVVEMNLTDSPYWVILYQDWVRISASDSNGNHPISTIKLKVFNGNLNICHYDNSWQWDYDFEDNVDGDIIDIDHSLHQENTKLGCAAINIGTNHSIDIWVYDDGLFQLYVDEDLISHKAYQTKSPTESHVLQWGQYWDKGYNKENDPLKRIVIRMSDLTISDAYH